MRLLGVFRFLFLCLFGLFSCIFFSASLFRLLHGFARSSSRTPYATKPLLIPYGIKSGTEYNNNKSIGMRLQLANQHAAMFNVLNSYFTANAFAHTHKPAYTLFFGELLLHPKVSCVVKERRQQQQPQQQTIIAADTADIPLFIWCVRR